MDNKGVLSSLKFIFVTVLILVLAGTSVMFTVLNMYKPTYRVTIGDDFIGYYANELEFEEVYNTLVSEKKQIDSDVKVYLSEEPNFEKSYIKDSLIISQNLYTSLREYVKSEYTIYTVSIEDENKMTFDTKDEADKYVDELYEEVPDVETSIIEEKVEELKEMTSIEVADNILEEVVDRNKPVIVPKTTTYTYSSTSSNISASTKIANVSAAEGGIWPTTATIITSHYGWRGASMHTGIDISGSGSHTNLAYKSGVVTFAGWNGGYGYLVIIDHGNGISTYYGHNSSLYVSAGDTVTMGQAVGAMGSTGYSTGPHLHFEIRINGKPVNPYNYII